MATGSTRYFEKWIASRLTKYQPGISSSERPLCITLRDQEAPHAKLL
jgi:hypothetical protein